MTGSRPAPPQVWLPWASLGFPPPERDPACQVYVSLPRYTLVPTSILLGLGAAPLWSAQGTYLTVTGNRHAEGTGQAGKDVVNQYFGIFFLIFQSSGVWGNLISSLVFGQKPTQGNRKWGGVTTQAPGSPTDLTPGLEQGSHDAPRPGFQPPEWHPRAPSGLPALPPTSGWV